MKRVIFLLAIAAVTVLFVACHTCSCTFVDQDGNVLVDPNGNPIVQEGTDSNCGLMAEEIMQWRTDSVQVICK